MIAARERSPVILTYWDRGMDTKDISLALRIPEHEVERQLHVALEMRWALVKCLRAGR